MRNLKLGVVGAAIVAAFVVLAIPAGATRSSRASLYGNYVATLTVSGLAAAGVDFGNVGGSGVWHLSITRRRLTFTPPHPYPSTTYPLVSLTASQVTLGPERQCSTRFGRTHNSVFRLSQTSSGLRFSTVTTACKEDGGALTVAAWRKTT